MNEFLEGLWIKIRIVFGELWPIIWPTLKVLLTEEGRAAKDAAIKIVKNVQETMPNASGAEKVTAVLTQLTAVLAAQGIVMGAEMLRTIIKIAYEYMVAHAETHAEAKQIQEMMQIADDAIIPSWVKQ
jgi:hypothetical protein